jgi:hypothetical protein
MLLGLAVGCTAAGEGVSALDAAPATPDAAQAVPSVDAGPGAWCGYDPDYTAAARGHCGNGCIAVLRQTGDPAILFSVDDDAPGTSIQLIGGGEGFSLVHSMGIFGSTGGDSVIAVPDDGGTPIRVDGFSGQNEVLTTAVIAEHVAYYVRAERVSDGAAYQKLVYAWPVGSTAPATLLGVASVTSMWDPSDVIVDGGFVYISSRMAGIDRLPVAGGAVEHVLDGPAGEVAVGDGWVFHVDAQGNIERVPAGGGPVVPIPSPVAPDAAFQLAIAPGSGRLVVAGWSSIGTVGEDGSAPVVLASLKTSSGPLVIDGNRAYIQAICRFIPDGSVPATAWVDLGDGTTGWVGEEPGFPFVPHADDWVAAGRWTPDGIFRYIVQW